MTTLLHEDFVQLVNDTKYQKQNYLNVIKSPSHRSMYSRIRINCTRLSDSPYSCITRKCTKCDKVCNFKHLLLECINTKSNRDNFYSNITKVLPDFKDSEIDFQYRNIINLEYVHLSPKEYNLAVSSTLAFVDTIYKSFV